MTTHTLPQGTMSQALIDAGVTNAVVTSSFVHFDLLQHIEDKLMQGELKARVLSSMAWMLDMRCINLARTVFFSCYRDALETGTIDAFNNFVNTMNEKAAEGDHTLEVGFSGQGSFSTLVTLLNMRCFWHARAYANATRRYEPKSLHELLLSEKVREVPIEGRAKLEARVKFAAGDDKELATKLYDSLLAKSNATLQQQFELRQKLNPAVMYVLRAAQNKATLIFDEECPPFHNLDIELQRSLIEASVGAAERALNDLINITSVTLDDYTIAFKDASAYAKGIKQVLAAPKFQNGTSAESAERQAKTAAYWAMHSVEAATLPAGESVRKAAVANGV